MAGLYPDAPAPRLAYDRDGTLAVIVNDNGTVTQLTGDNTGILAIYNNESSDYGAYQAGFGTYGLEVFGTQQFCLIFPSPRTIVGWRFGWIGRSLDAASWSADTTNGYDGTWNALAAPGGGGAQTKDALRSGITTLAGVSGVKAIRFRGNGSVYGTTIGAMHLYGYPTNVGDRLQFWHPTQDLPLSDFPAHLDWGDQPRGAVLTKSVRIRNRSNSLTANNISVGLEALTDASPSLVAQHEFRYNGGAWGAGASISVLAPATTSQIIDIRYTVAANAQMSLWSQRYVASAGQWT